MLELEGLVCLYLLRARCLTFVFWIYSVNQRVVDSLAVCRDNSHTTAAWDTLTEDA
jgi:hypothetical protein